MKKKFILLILLLILIVAGVFYYFNEKNNSTVLSIENNIVDFSVKESTNTADPVDPNVSVYTSYKLGVSFSYLAKDAGLGYGGFFSDKPIEEGDRISLDKSNYIRVFQKLPGESIEQTIRRITPESFVNTNCSVYSAPYNKLNYFIWDKRASVDQHGSDSTDLVSNDGIYLTNICNPVMKLDFETDPNFPETVYYIGRETQAVSYWADSSHEKSWFQTVHLIAK
jgi:hypothetical protein